MQRNNMGITIIIVGLAAIVIGVLVHFGLLSWFGRLPGDIRYESANSRVYIPITSMILISLSLSLIMYLIRRFF